MGSAPITSENNSLVHKQVNKFHRSGGKVAGEKQLEKITPEDKANIVSVLKRHCLFSLLRPEKFEECANCFHKFRCFKGSYIYRQYECSEEAYIISQGRFSIEIDCTLVKVYGALHYFGQDTLAYDTIRAQSIRVSTEDAVLFAISKEDFQKNVKSLMQNYKSDIEYIFTRVHFFNYLTNKERKFLIQNTIMFNYQKGDTIFEKEQDANSFYIIKKGTVAIQIEKKNQIIMKKDDYFGQSAFLSLLSKKTSNKSQRMGKAVSNQDNVEVFSIGLSSVKKCLGHYIRSIIFFNQQKWALYRDPVLLSMDNVDYNHLLQYFNVKEGGKYSVLARNDTELKYLFIPLQAEINKNRALKLYGSEYLKPQNWGKTLNYDIILTDAGYYAYAPIQQICEVLNIKHPKCTKDSLTLKLQRQPLQLHMTLTLKNVSKYSRKLHSSKYVTVLIVQDMKFGNEFIVKVYKKQKKASCSSNKYIEDDGLHRVIPLKSSTSMKILPEFGSMRNNCLKESTNRQILTTEKNLKLSRQCISSKKQICQQVTIESVDNKINPELVLRQKHIIESLCNRFVCGYYRCQQDSNNYYIFMQFIKGSSLFEVHREFGIMPEPLIKFYLASLLSCLEYLHSERVILRDLKPENVIIRSTGQLVIVDFGCSKRLPSENDRTNTILGTPHYMAPEMIEQKQYTFNVDFWALGVILYEQMTGKLPFGNDLTDPYSICQAVLTQQVTYRHFSNKYSQSLLSLLLKKDPEKRAKSASQIKSHPFISELQFRWAEFSAGELDPPFFPQKNHCNYTNVNNYGIFDLDTIEDWSE